MHTYIHMYVCVYVCVFYFCWVRSVCCLFIAHCKICIYLKGNCLHCSCCCCCCCCLYSSCVSMCSVMRIERGKKLIEHTRVQEWKAKANCSEDKEKHMSSATPPPLQLCLLLPNAAAATDARWRCCLSTNQFTIVFSFLFFRHKHKKCCNFEKQVPTRALRCRLSLSRCAALQLLLLLLGIWLWNAAAKVQCARAPHSADVDVDTSYTWVQAATTVQHVIPFAYANECVSVPLFLGALIECVTTQKWQANWIQVRTCTCMLVLAFCWKCVTYIAEVFHSRQRQR